MAKTKAHIRYKTLDGSVVPGVTTVIGDVLAKPWLVVWANRMGLEGIDSTKYRDDKADIGSLAHQMIMAHLNKEELDTTDYSEKQIQEAKNCIKSFLEWEKHHKLESIFLEQPLVSEKHRFGGTIDFYGYVNGELSVVDFKTGRIYDEATIQVSAYKQLLLENGSEVKNLRILSIPRSDNDAFEEKHIRNDDIGWQIFLHCRALYNLKKNL